jgi:precorrin-8X/cobalt-precorrin-8 methylmutase
MIHTSADFNYLQSVRFHPEAVEAGIAAIRSGCAIVTDTHMARAGIRKTDLERFGASATCYIGDPGVRQRAAQSGSTRAQAAVDAAVGDMAGGIFVVGNAPTALLQTDIPFISNVGRKGGSNVAASVINALAKLALEGNADA